MQAIANRSNVEQARRARLCLLIQNGKAENWYTVRPLSTTDEFAVGFRLTKQLKPHDFYSVTMTEAGAVRCNCAGHVSHRRCKHADALQALGLIDADQYLDARKAQLEAELERDLLQGERTAAAQARQEIDLCLATVRVKPTRKARRLHQPANPLSNPADDLRAALTDIDITTTAGKRKAKNACRAIAARHDMPANDLWRDVCFEPQGFAENVA